MDFFSKLPDELLLAIFMHVEHPNSFASTNKRLHNIACNTLNIVRWLEYRYYRNEIIFYALLHLGDRSHPLFEPLLQRDIDCPNYLLYGLIRDAQRRSTGQVSLQMAPGSGSATERLIRMDTVMQLYACVKQRRSDALGPGEIVAMNALDGQAAIELARLIREYESSNGAGDLQEPPPASLLQNRQAFVESLTAQGSPVYSRASAIAYAIILLQKGHDVEWRLRTLGLMVDFPHFELWTFLKPVCDVFIGSSRGSKLLHRLRTEVGLAGMAIGPDRIFEPNVAKYLFQQNAVGMYRYGYAAIDSEIHVSLPASMTIIPHTTTVQWSAFLEAAGRTSTLKEMITRLLCSYRGMRLVEDSLNFQLCYDKLVRVGPNPERVRRAGPRRRDSDPRHYLVTSFHDCPLFMQSQPEIDAFWLVLYVKNKISQEPGLGRDIDFMRARTTFNSVIYLLSYPWLTSAEIVASLSHAGLYLSKDYNLQSILKRALKKVMQNAYCGMHLIVLAGKLDKPVPIIERLVSPNTADAILLYPEIDDRYSDDPLIAGLQAYKLDIPSRKASYSDTGPKIHLPLALDILEVVKDKNSPALKLLLERARVKKIDKIVQAYERAGVQS